MANFTKFITKVGLSKAGHMAINAIARNPGKALAGAGTIITATGNTAATMGTAITSAGTTLSASTAAASTALSGFATAAAPVVATAVTVVAPVAIAGGAVYGAYKLYQKLKK